MSKTFPVLLIVLNLQKNIPYVPVTDTTPCACECLGEFAGVAVCKHQACMCISSEWILFYA